MTVKKKESESVRKFLLVTLNHVEKGFMKKPRIDPLEKHFFHFLSALSKNLVVPFYKNGKGG